MDTVGRTVEPHTSFQSVYGENLHFQIGFVCVWILRV